MMHRIGGKMHNLISTAIPALLVVVALRVLVFGLYVVPTGSMLRTIHAGDFVLGERVSRPVRPPALGDVVTFESPGEPGVTLVKRVVATEGQLVDLRGGCLWVDGVLLDEPYAVGETLAPASGDAAMPTYPHAVAEGCVWVMGDNREASRDSRWFGDVPVGSVTSRVLLVYWPPEDVGCVR